MIARSEEHSSGRGYLGMNRHVSLSSGDVFPHSLVAVELSEWGSHNTCYVRY